MGEEVSIESSRESSWDLEGLGEEVRSDQVIALGGSARRACSTCLWGGRGFDAR